MIQGQWYSAGSKFKKTATFNILDSVSYFVETDDGVVVSGELAKVNMKEQLENVERELHFEDGSRFVTYYNNAMDNIFKKEKKSYKIFIYGFLSLFLMMGYFYFTL